LPQKKIKIITYGPQRLSVPLSEKVILGVIIIFMIIIIIIINEYPEAGQSGPYISVQYI